MDDFKVMARLLAAIRAGEKNPPFSPAMVGEKVVKAPAAKRDGLAIKMQKAGYIEGLFVVDDIDNMPAQVVMWQYSAPSVTLEGLCYMRECKPLKDAFAELAAEVAKAAIHAAPAAISAAAQTL